MTKTTVHAALLTLLAAAALTTSSAEARIITYRNHSR
jgi:hypothetical protein